MTDLSPNSDQDQDLTQIVASLGALPDAPMAMPIQTVERPRLLHSTVSNWLRPRLQRHAKAGR